MKAANDHPQPLCAPQPSYMARLLTLPAEDCYEGSREVLFVYGSRVVGCYPRRGRGIHAHEQIIIALTSCGRQVPAASRQPARHYELISIALEGEVRHGLAWNKQ